MPNNPVQIVLNDDAFLRPKDPGGWGPPKDFFSGNSPAFIQHRDRLIAKLKTIRDDLQASHYGPAVYLRVVMRDQALAKSYRPSSALFLKELFPCVGAGAIGVLYYRVALHYIDRLIEAFETAEDAPTVKVKEDGTVYEVTRARSEVGAIADLDEVEASDKIMFDIEEALAKLQEPATVSGYRVELYETYSPQTLSDDLLGRRRLQQSFVETFMSLAPGVRGTILSAPGKAGLMEFQLTDDRDAPPLLVDQSRLLTSELRPAVRVADTLDEPARHEDALRTLAKHPLVKAIRAPLQLHLSDTANDADATEAFLVMEPPSASATYPAVGVIDSGLKTPMLTSWVIGRHDRLDEDEYDGEHGSRVAGVVAAGNGMNTITVAPEPMGCQIFDIPLYPEDDFLDVFPNGFEELVEEIGQAVSDAKALGVRVFNMSLNLDEVSPTEYGLAAARLDEIADAEDVVFVISAGNLPQSQHRTPWQSRPSDVVSYFAGRQATDAIQQPAESVRSLAVGAINPPDRPHLERAPTTYTRRGPGLQVGVKPDLCAFGGSLHGAGQPTGLFSCDASGRIVPVSGTSFAAPLVARTIAGIDHVTQGTAAKETLRALMIHHSEMPYPLTRRGVSKQLGPQFGGFGMVSSTSDILQTDDHTITFVFESRLTTLEPRPAMLRFPFTWPQSLVDDEGACSGLVRATLVYSPPLDPAFGAEFVRVNLNASLRQRSEIVTRDGEIKDRWDNRIAQRNLPNNGGSGLTEKALIQHGLKWWPTKAYHAKLNNKGHTSDWRVEVQSLVRTEAQFPPEGVPFSLIVTISDPAGAAPVFAEMQRSLANAAANVIDIRSRAQVQLRGG